MDNNNRIQFLDGLRGVAILSVILYHAYARWTALVPYGDKLKVFPFTCGWIGVQLFFVISGFVILLTLEKCDNFVDFMLRRWLRLFPAMLACSLIVFLTLPLFPERPAGHPQLVNLLPGLTFIDDPFIWRRLFGTAIHPLEGTFWSLFVEVKFYILFGAMYFLTNRYIAIIFILLSAVFAKVVASSLVVAHFPHGAYELAKLVNVLGAEHFGWFAAGALFYQYTGARRMAFLILGVGVAMFASMLTRGFESGVALSILAALAVVVLFTAALLLPSVQKVLSYHALLFIGFISYPLYLLHENMMVAMIIKVGHLVPGMPAILMPLLPIATVISLGWVVAAHIEPRIRSMLRPPYTIVRRSMGVG